MPKLHNGFLSLSGIFLSEMMLVWDDMQPANSGCFGIIKISGNFPAIRSANRTNWGNTPMDSWIQGITAERRGIHRMMNQSNTGNVKQELPMSLLHFASMFLHQCLSRLGTAKRHAECIKNDQSWVSMGLHFDPPCPKHICPMNFTLSGIKMFENRARKKWPLHGPTSENRIPQHLVVYDHQNGNELRAAAGVAHFQTRPAWYRHGTAIHPFFQSQWNPMFLDE